MKKNKNVKEDNVVELILGSCLIGINNFNEGMLIEKILVLVGFVILITGIIRTFFKYKEQKKTGMMLFLILMGILAVVYFIALLYRFITG